MMAEARERILVIDDEMGIREGCRRVLEPHGYQVELAASGREGLRLFQADSFDLVLLDVMMPDMRGTDLLAPIYEKDPNVVCIIITGYATVELAIQAIKAGAYDFLSKPFTADVLLMTVAQGLERRRLSLEAQRSRQLEERTAALAHEKEELERLDRFKTSFMLTVAHELRAPLTAMQSFLLAVLKGYIPPEEQQEVLERAVGRSQELLDLIDDLLKLARVKSEQGMEKREPVALAGVLEKVWALHKAEADEKGLVSTVIIRQRPQVEANPAQMTQLWTNLISNAIKYTPKGGRVMVVLEEENGWAVGTVEDSGIGIAPEDQPRVFEEFYRTVQAKEFQVRGTGLGLPLVKRVVEAYGGAIELESELGRGSRFTFHLPAIGAPSGSSGL